MEPTSEQLKQVYVLALAAVKSENAQLAQKHDTAVKQRDALADALRDIKRHKDDLHEEYTKLKEETDTREKELREGETAMDEKISHLKSSQEALQQASAPEMTSETLHKEAHRVKIDKLQKEISYVRELSDCWRKLADSQKELAAERKKEIDILSKLVSKADEYRQVEDKLHETKRVAENLTNKMEMLTIRQALAMFEETVVGVCSDETRGEEWDRFFSESEQASHALSATGFKCSVKETVTELFARMNCAVHEIYPLDYVMTMQEECLQPNEQQLIQAVWTLTTQTRIIRSLQQQQQQQQS